MFKKILRNKNLKFKRFFNQPVKKVKFNKRLIISIIIVSFTIGLGTRAVSFHKKYFEFLKFIEKNQIDLIQNAIFNGLNSIKSKENENLIKEILKIENNDEIISFEKDFDKIPMS
jgi:hypothetical protein